MWFVNYFVIFEVVNLDIQLCLISFILAVMLIFENENQILVRCVDVKIDVIIFCGVLRLDDGLFLPRVFDLHLTYLWDRVFGVDALLAEVEVVIIEDYESLWLNDKVFRVLQDWNRHRFRITLRPSVKRTFVQEKGRELIIQLNDFLSWRTSNEQLEKRLVFDQFGWVGQKLLEFKVVFCNFFISFCVVAVHFPFVFKLVDIIQIQRIQYVIPLLVDHQEQILGARDKCFANVDWLILGCDLDSVHGLSGKCIDNQKVITKTGERYIRPTDAECSDWRV